MKRIACLILGAMLTTGLVAAQAEDLAKDLPTGSSVSAKHRKTHRKHRKNGHRGHIDRRAYPQA